MRRRLKSPGHLAAGSMGIGDCPDLTDRNRLRSVVANLSDFLFQRKKTGVESVDEKVGESEERAVGVVIHEDW